MPPPTYVVSPTSLPLPHRNRLYNSTMDPSDDLSSLQSQAHAQVLHLQGQLTALPPSAETQDLLQVLHLHAGQLQACHTPLNPFIMIGFFHTVLKLLAQLTECAGQRSSKARENLIVNTAKLNAMVSSWDRAAYETPSDDLLALPRDHERWKRLSEHTEIRAANDPAAQRSFIQDAYKSAIWAHAFISKGQQYKDPTMRKIMTGFYVFYYSLNAQAAYHQARLNFASPPLDSIVTLARAQDSVLARALLTNPLKTECNRLVYLCRQSSRMLEKPESETIPVRVVSASRIAFQKSLEPALFPLPQDPTLPSTRPNKVVLHVHGGGFMSMSTALYVSYLQKWSLDISGAVFFSVDYRLAPENPYPAGLDDVWQTYKWLVNEVREELDIDTTKILVMGDSAGGHLAIGCVLRAIQAGIRVPDGLVLPYPPLNMDPDHYTPSFTLSLDDMVMNYTFLKSCQAAYVQSSALDPRNDPFLSPVSASLDLLRQFPPTRILVGTLDPLMDDCLRFAERLLEAGVDTRLSLFEGAVHGGPRDLVKIENEDVKALPQRTSNYLQELLS